MEKKRIIILSIIYALIIAGTIYLVIQNQNSISGNVTKDTKLVKASAEYDLSYLSTNNLVQQLPKSANIELIIISNPSYVYTLTKGSVKPGQPSNPDMTITLPSKYLPDLKSSFCQALANANKKRDLGLEIHGSELKVSLKYAGMLKFKSCLGL